MSNDTQKADQIALHLFTKLFQVVYQARITREPRPSQKVDKWFNLETPETDALSKDDRDKFKSISSSPPQPLEIQVLLTVPELGNNQVLVYHPDAVSGTQPPQIRIYPTPKRILLESWTLSYTPRDGPPDTTVPSTTYKHGILLFRTVFSLLRLLPAWRLHKRRGARTMGVDVRIKAAQSASSARPGHARSSSSIDRTVRGTAATIPGGSSPLSASNSTLVFAASLPMQTKSHTFPPILHPTGALALTVTYLDHPDFRIEELERFYSDGVIAQYKEDASEFVPTLVKNQQRDSFASSRQSATSSSRRDSFSAPKRESYGGLRQSPVVAIQQKESSSGLSRRGSPSGSYGIPQHDTLGNLPVRTSLPRSPPREQFMSSSPGGRGVGLLSRSPPQDRLGPHSRTSSLSHVSLGSQVQSDALSGHTPPPGPVQRIRKESGTSSVDIIAYPLPTSSPRPLTALSSSPRATSALSSPPGAPPLLSSSERSTTSPLPAPSRSPTSPLFPGTRTSALSASRPSSLSTASAAQRTPSLSATSSSSSTARPIISPFTSDTYAASTSLSRIASTSGSPMPLTGSPRHVSTSPKVTRAASQLASGSTGSGISPSGDDNAPDPQIPRRKRYSSSFGHRYTSSGGRGTAVGSAGSSGDAGGHVFASSSEGSNNPGGIHDEGGGHASVPGESSQGASPAGRHSFLRTATDDDDISLFMQDIAKRKPLRRHSNSSSPGRSELDAVDALALPTASRSPLSSLATATDTTVSLPSSSSANPTSDSPAMSGIELPAPSPVVPSPSLSGASASSAASTALPSNAADIEERLRTMNERFFESLRGLGSVGRGRGRGRPEPSSQDAAPSDSDAPDTVAEQGSNRL